MQDACTLQQSLIESGLLMKWLFGVLVLISLAFAALIQWGDPWTDQHKNHARPAELNTDKIRLLDALPPPPADPLPSPVPPAAQTPPEKAGVCPECGKTAITRPAEQPPALTTFKLADQLLQQPAENTVRYWVYIPPAPTRAKLDKTIAELKKRNIRNFYTVQKPGPWKNAISLGVFQSSNSARKALNQLHAQGIKTAIMGELKHQEESAE